MTLGPGERRLLLALARDAVESEVRGAPPRLSIPTDGPLSAPGAAFVTLHSHGSLRGCIGTFDRSRSLAQTVREVAMSAAVDDPRFPRVHEDELASLSLDVSILTPPGPATSGEVEVGRHGLQIAARGRRGVLLPQVATEHGWDRERFLSETCRKAGLPPDAWRDPTTRIETFEAEVFGEPEDDDDY